MLDLTLRLPVFSASSVRSAQNRKLRVPYLNSP